MKKGKCILIIILVLLIFSSTTFAQQQPDKDLTLIVLKLLTSQRWWTIDRIASELKLTEEQINQIEEIYLEYNKEIIQLRADAQVKQFELEYLMQQEEMDMPAIEKTVSELVETHKIIEHFEIMTRVKMLNVLDMEQRKKLMIIVAKLIKQGKKSGG